MALTISVLAIASGAVAQDKAAIPPQDGRKASQIVIEIEQRPDFRYLESVTWNDEGYYEVIYHTGDQAKIEMTIDARTGKPVPK
ncbi:MAG: PepSY domain-containing protein [Rhizobiaceae bacterium]